eukprot:3969765-Pleurochrysis_carterae.AAC.1
MGAHARVARVRARSRACVRACGGKLVNIRIKSARLCMLMPRRSRRASETQTSERSKRFASMHAYTTCCAPIIRGVDQVPTPEPIYNVSALTTSL